MDRIKTTMSDLHRDYWREPVRVTCFVQSSSSFPYRLDDSNKSALCKMLKMDCRRLDRPDVVLVEVA